MIIKREDWMTDYPTTGSRVKRLRIARLMTCEELADKVGVTPDDIDRMEQGYPVDSGVEGKVMTVLAGGNDCPVDVG